MNEKKLTYKSDLPYPEIKVLGQNCYYACLIKEDYSSSVSEMTAINQYLYHHFVLEGEFKEIGKILEGIAIVEMHHLEILAELITKLGEKPIYYSQNNFWNGSYVNYGCTLYDQLVSDLNSEYEAIEHYKYHIQIINDPYIKEILQRIILDEDIHAQILTELIKKFNYQ